MTVRIIFLAPSRGEHPARFHERSLEGVPYSTAQQMARDFVAHGNESSDDSRWKLYTYHVDGHGAKEAVVPLDFGEIVALFASPE